MHVGQEAECHLISASSNLMRHHGMIQIDRFFKVFTRSSSNYKIKEVYLLHQRSDPSEKWEAIKAKFHKTIDENRNIWIANITWINKQISGMNDPLNPFIYGTSFVIKTEFENGESLYDNNKDKDYNLSLHGGVLLGDNYPLLLSFSTFNHCLNSKTNCFSGAIHLKNITHQKKVRIIYSLDDWITHDFINAYYNSYFYPSYSESIMSPNEQGVEIWSFQKDIKMGELEEKIVFYVEYDSDGRLFKDDNFGCNYLNILNQN